VLAQWQRNCVVAEFDYQKHYLTEEESEQIFRSQIVPREIAGKAEPVDRTRVE